MNDADLERRGVAANGARKKMLAVFGMVKRHENYSQTTHSRRVDFEIAGGCVEDVAAAGSGDVGNFVSGGSVGGSGVEDNDVGRVRNGVVGIKEARGLELNIRKVRGICDESNSGTVLTRKVIKTVEDTQGKHF